MPSHVLYVEDSGTKEQLSPQEEYYKGDGKSRYFVFGAALITTQESDALTSRIRALKRDTFGTSDVEIKSNWLRMPEERNERYIVRFGLSEEDLARFVDSYYEAILNTDLLLMAAVVDKVHLSEVYSNPWYPPAVAYEVLLQRAENELKGKGDYSVVMDDMTGKTPRGTEYKRNLFKQHEMLKQRGSKLLDGYKFMCIQSRLKFVSSANTHMVQVADIAAYNVYRQFRDYGEEWEDRGLKSLPTYDHFARIAGKFRQGPEGRIQGYGVVKFPLKERVAWGVRVEK